MIPRAALALSFVLCASMLATTVHPVRASAASSALTSELVTSVFIERGEAFTNSTAVTMTVEAHGPAIITNVALSNDGVDWTTFPYAPTVPWTLPAVDGTRTVWARWGDDTGAWTEPLSDSIVLDRVIPTVTAPSVPAFITQTVEQSSVALRFSWAGSDVGAGVSGYEVQQSRNGGSWTAASSPTVSRATVPARFFATIRYRLRARDHAGNVSGWRYTTTVKPVLKQQTSTSLVWRGRWTSASSSLFLGTSSRWATGGGASVSYRFTGRSIAWVSSKGHTSGSARIYIDGVHVKTVSLFTTGFGEYRRLLFSKAWTARGTHTIRVVVAGTAGHARVDVDAFLRLD